MPRDYEFNQTVGAGEHHRVNPYVFVVQINHGGSPVSAHITQVGT